MVLSRLLGPRDFGLLGMVMAFTPYRNLTGPAVLPILVQMSSLSVAQDQNPGFQKAA